MDSRVTYVQCYQNLYTANRGDDVVDFFSVDVLGRAPIAIDGVCGGYAVMVT